MKKTFVLVILAMILMTACQPTPEIEIVQNKNDEDLAEAIATTATPAPEATDAVAEETQAAEANEVIAYVEDVSSNASNTVTVDIDAEVINNQPNNIPVAKIASYEYTEEEILQIIEAFFGNTVMYTKDYTKEDYDYLILNKQYQLNDPEQLQAYADDRDITDLEVAKENIQAAIDRFIVSRADAPDERIVTDYQTALNSDRGFNVLLQTMEGFLGNATATLMTAFNDDDIYYSSRYLGEPEYIEPDCTDEEYLAAKEIAIQMVEDMGIDNVQFTDAYLSKDYSDYDVNGVQYWNGREYYVFYFDTVIGGSVIDNNEEIIVPPALTDMSGKDGYEDAVELVFEEVIPYESLEIWVEGDKVVQFRQRYPLVVTEIVNDNVAIEVDYLEAIELAKQYAYTAFIDSYGLKSESKLEIYKIELVLIRIKEIDTGDYIVVPAWNFCGAYLFKYYDEDYVDPEENEEGWAVRQGVEGISDALITINALDGTVIDLSHGY